MIDYHPGDLVTWYESYADGFLTKEVGRGVVLKKRKFNLGFKEGPYTNYMVYRTKHKDTMIFEERELEKVTSE